MSKEVHLLVVGKLHDPALEIWEQDYVRRMTFPSITIHEVKASGGNKEEEAKNIFLKINELRRNGPVFPIVLDPHGSICDSLQFSSRLYDLLTYQKSRILFIIGGANGLDEKVLKEAGQSISLSALTFPHKLARIIFIEQLYRAQTIHLRHPYHH